MAAAVTKGSVVGWLHQGVCLQEAAEVYICESKVKKRRIEEHWVLPYKHHSPKSNG